MTHKFIFNNITQRNYLLFNLRFLSHANLAMFLLMSMLISCGGEDDPGPEWDVVTGEYEGMLYLSKPLEPLHEAEPFPDQTVQVSKIGQDTYRLSFTNPNVPTFDFRYDHQTTNNVGVISNEYYFTIAAQTNNGVSVQASSLVFDKDSPGIDFSVFSGNGDTLWVFGGQKK